MSGLQKRSQRTVRPRSVRRAPVWCLLAFVLTSLAVYRWGEEHWIPTNPRPTYTATAYVVQQETKPGAGEVRIPLVHTDRNRRLAEEIANAQAERCVKERYTEWRSRAEQSYQEAYAAAEKARREQAQKDAHLKAFRRQMAEAAGRAQADHEPSQKPLPPPMVDNPHWLDLNRQLADLKRRYDDLLVDRTPLHPTVQYLAVQIDDLRKQMASVPQRIPDTRPASLSQPLSPKQEAATADNLVAKQNREKLGELTAAVESARRAIMQAEAVEKQAREELRRGPQCTVVYARSIEVPPTPDYGWRRLMCTTLAAGLLMALGAGSLSAGANIEPPVANAAEVKSASGVAVLGTVPAEDPVSDPPGLSRRRSRARHALLTIGLILAAASPTAAVWGVMGI